jgi:hypothetical protein
MGEEQMRFFALTPVLLLAACGGGETEQKVAAPRAASIAAGQWQLSSEVTAFRGVDQGTPKIDAPVGTRAETAACVAEGHQPPTSMFSGEGYRCNYDSFYARNGRLSATLACSREGLSGQVMMGVDGTFDGSTITFDREIRTVLATDGDVEFTEHVTGRLGGACTPEASEEGGNSSEAGNASSEG